MQWCPKCEKPIKRLRKDVPNGQKRSYSGVIRVWDPEAREMIGYECPHCRYVAVTMKRFEGMTTAKYTEWLLKRDTKLSQKIRNLIGEYTTVQYALKSLSNAPNDPDSGSKRLRK